MLVFKRVDGNKWVQLSDSEVKEIEAKASDTVLCRDSRPLNFHEKCDSDSEEDPELADLMNGLGL
ncbi:MAG: hypothetical protein VW378_04855 [bacterium]